MTGNSNNTNLGIKREKKGEREGKKGEKKKEKKRKKKRGKNKETKSLPVEQEK